MKKNLLIIAVVLLAVASFSAFAQNAPAPAVKTAADVKAIPAPAASDTTPMTSITTGGQENTIVTHGDNIITINSRRGQCEQKKTSTIDINFNYPEPDIAQLSKEIDARIADIKSQALKAGVTSIDLAEMNYNARSDRRNNDRFRREDEDNTSYNITGRFHFNVSPAEKAAALVGLLNANKDYQISLDVRMGGMFCPPSGMPNVMPVQ